MAQNPRIVVLAGVNGTGKSSVGGAMFREKGANYFNPDEAARKLIEANPEISAVDANIAAWQQGISFLEQAIAERIDYTFETTLGGETITSLLEKAISAGIEVWVWYVGLSSQDLCIARVKARVAAGGHPIPEAKIRERYIKSPLNLIRLLPNLSKLIVFDNSEDGDPCNGKRPQPRLILDMEHGHVVSLCDLPCAPEWTKPILAVALKPSAFGGNCQKPETPKKPENTIILRMWLDVQNNNKFVRGRKRAMEDIDDLLRYYNCRRLHKDGNEYELSLSYVDDADLDRTIYEMISEIDSRADMRHCCIECDLWAVDDSDRRW